MEVKLWPAPKGVIMVGVLSRGVDLDLSWPPCAAKKNLMEGNLHHQMGQNFINFFHE